jgi:hypothetical protein
MERRVRACDAESCSSGGVRFLENLTQMLLWEGVEGELLEVRELFEPLLAVNVCFSRCVAEGIGSWNGFTLRW